METKLSSSGSTAGTFFLAVIGILFGVVCSVPIMYFLNKIGNGNILDGIQVSIHWTTHFTVKTVTVAFIVISITQIVFFSFAFFKFVFENKKCSFSKNLVQFFKSNIHVLKNIFLCITLAYVVPQMFVEFHLI